MTKEIIIRAIRTLRKQEKRATTLGALGVDLTEFMDEAIGSLEEMVVSYFTGGDENAEPHLDAIYDADTTPEEVYKNLKVKSYGIEPGIYQLTDMGIIVDLGNEEHITGSINNIVSFCHGQSRAAGWHDKPREVGTDLMLIVSEIAEAMEGDRKGLMDDHLPHRKMFEVELADAVIRIFDTAGKYGLDLGGAVREKLEYNKNRADHKRENRAAEGGKKY